MNNHNKSQFFSTREEIIKWLDKYNIKNYTINNDLSVDVDDHVDISNQKLKTIPVKFGNVTGSFWCDGNKLINLAGSPESVGGNFDCANNQLIGLLDSPKFIGGNHDAVGLPVAAGLAGRNIFRKYSHSPTSKEDFYRYYAKVLAKAKSEV